MHHVVLYNRAELLPGTRLSDIPDERCVKPRSGFLDRHLPWPDQQFRCLRFFHSYIDAIFNQSQMAVFLTEWQEMEKLAQMTKDKEDVARIKGLAIRCRDEEGFYLRFMAD